MDKPNKGLTGAVYYFSSTSADMWSDAFQVVAVYIAGEAVGALTQTAIGDQLGRIRFMQLMCVIVTIGTVVQTAAQNIGMFLAGRVLAGIAVGYDLLAFHQFHLMLTRNSGMVATVPIYLSEISGPKDRGLIGGISGCGISLGTMTSNWVGFACSCMPQTTIRHSLLYHPTDNKHQMPHMAQHSGVSPLASKFPGASSCSSVLQHSCQTHLDS
jgi:MFS family permease